jgi:hypothetical protein
MVVLFLVVLVDLDLEEEVEDEGPSALLLLRLLHMEDAVVAVVVIESSLDPPSKHNES